MEHMQKSMGGPHFLSMCSIIFPDCNVVEVRPRDNYNHEGLGRNNGTHAEIQWGVPHLLGMCSIIFPDCNVGEGRPRDSYNHEGLGKNNGTHAEIFEVHPEPEVGFRWTLP